MILEEATYEAFGHYPSDLKPKSGKRILAACDNCGKVRIALKYNYHGLCNSCARKGNRNTLGHTLTEEHKAKLSAAKKGKCRGEKNHNWHGGVKLAWTRHAAKRRNLGDNELMPVKEGEDGHHPTDRDIIGISHDVHVRLNGGGRKKHRTKVLQWLKLNDKKKYNLALCALAKEPLN